MPAITAPVKKARRPTSRQMSMLALTDNVISLKSENLHSRNRWSSYRRFATLSKNCLANFDEPNSCSAKRITEMTDVRRTSALIHEKRL